MEVPKQLLIIYVHRKDTSFLFNFAQVFLVCLKIKKRMDFTKVPVLPYYKRLKQWHFCIVSYTHGDNDEPLLLSIKIKMYEIIGIMISQY